MYLLIQNTMLAGKLFKLFIALLLKKKKEKRRKKKEEEEEEESACHTCLVISKNCLLA